MLGWLFGFLWLAVLKTWLGAHSSLDADALGVADLWNSLAAGGHLGDWTMGPHPYLFPDLPLYGLASLWFKGVLARQLGFGLVQGCLLWLFLARLMRRLAGLDASLARAYAAAGLMLLLLLLDPVQGLGQALVPGYHGGALLCGVGFLAWAARQDQRTSSLTGTLWVGFWLGLVWASDQLTPALALLPALAFSIGLTGQARRRVWGAVGLAWLSRWSFLWFLREQGMRVASFQWAFLREHFTQQWVAFSGFVPAALVSSALPLGLSLLALVLLLGGRKERPLEACFGLAAFLSGLLGVAVAVAEGSPQGRYFLGPVWLCLPWLPLLAGRFLGGKPLPLLAMALVGLLSLGMGPRPGDSPRELVQAQWLDKATASLDSGCGLAVYDLARPLRMLGSRRILPAQTLAASLSLNPWFADRRLFAAAGPVRFVVLTGLDPDAVRRSMGAPLGTAQGEGLQVWFYAKPHS